MTLTVTILIIAAMVAGYTDWRTRRIPNWLTAGMAGYGIVFHASRAGWEGLLASLSGLAVGLGLLLIPYLLRGLGAGDVKFLAAVGSIVGVTGVLVVFVAASALGAVLGIVALSRRQKMERAVTEGPPPVSIPYGVALSFGTLVLTGVLAAWWGRA